MPDPAPADAPPCDGFATIAIVFSMPEAAVLLATLDGHGIVALARNQRHISVQPFLMSALGVRIIIPVEQLDEALASMERIDRGWRRPPPPSLPIPAWLAVLLWIWLSFAVMAPPMPQRPGSYRWRSPGMGAPLA